MIEVAGLCEPRMRNLNNFGFGALFVGTFGIGFNEFTILSC